MTAVGCSSSASPGKSDAASSDALEAPADRAVETPHDLGTADAFDVAGTQMDVLHDFDRPFDLAPDVLPDVPPDLGHRDAPELDASHACGPHTCDADTVCLRVPTGLDGGTDLYICAQVPAACGGVPTCACVDADHSISAQYCLQSCSQQSDRQFTCGGG
jgi:hypothetical protein